MKIIVLTLFLVSGINLVAQDTLIFKYGKYRVGDVIEINPDGILVYIDHGDTIAIHKSEIIEYSNEGNWYHLTADSTNFELIPKSTLKLKRNFFYTAADYTYGRFSISTNLTSPFLFNVNKLNIRAGIFAHNPIISIEPEYQISDKIAIKIPVLVGLNNNSPTPLNSNELIRSNNNYSSQKYYINGDYGRYTFPMSINYGKNAVEFLANEEYPYTSRKYSHTQNVIAQIGISPRFYPFGQRKQSLYLAQTFAIGIADYYANDFYINVDTVESINPM